MDKPILHEFRHTDEIKAQISRSMKAYLEKHPRIYTPEKKNKISEGMIKWHASRKI